MSDSVALSAEELAERLRAMRSEPPVDYERDIWSCKVGETTRATLRAAMGPGGGADAPMREAVSEAFFRLTGTWPTFIFSGWGRSLTEGERAVVENREPVYDKTDYGGLTQAAELIERQALALKAVRDLLQLLNHEGQLTAEGRERIRKALTQATEGGGT